MNDFFDDSHVTDLGLEGSAGPSVSIWDMVQQGFRQQYRVDSQRALDEELRTRWADSLRALGAAGQRFNAPVDPLMYRGFAQFVRDGTLVTTPTVEGSGYGARINYDAQQPHVEFEEMRRANEAIRQLNNPDIRTFEQILEEVGEMQRGVEEQTASMSERAGTSGFFGELIGAIGGSFTTRDPLNIVTAPIGAGRTVAARIASDMAVAAGVVTATEFGDVAPNRALAGLPERNPLLNIAAATIGAGVIRGAVIEPAGYALRRFRERPAVEDIDFDRRDRQLQQLFADNADRPSARAAASMLDDTIFIERNNPYGEGRAASERFMAELRSVQRSMNGEPMTAVARVLPPVPFEYIQKAADFEIVREQASTLNVRMEQAQARLEELTRQVEALVSSNKSQSAQAPNIPYETPARFVDQTTPVHVGDMAAPGFQLRLDAENYRRMSVESTGKNWTRAEARIRDLLEKADEQDVAASYISQPLPRRNQELLNQASREEYDQALTRLRELRREANTEYQAAYRAVEAEAARLHEAQTRAEAAQQREASNILSVVSEGRPFVGSLLRYDSVESLVERINAFNETLDEATIARFIRETEGARANIPVPDNIRGDLPASGLAPANLAEDGNIYVGRQGGSHFDVIEQFPKNEGKWTGGTGFVTPEGKFLNREEALEWVEANEGPIRPSSNMEGELDALDYRDQSAVVKANRERDKGETVLGREAWLTEDGRVDIGLREPVDPDFRVPTDDGDISVIEAMRDLQDDADLVEAVRSCSI